MTANAVKKQNPSISEPEVTPALAKTYGMKADEFERMEKILGRLNLVINFTPSSFILPFSS